MNTPIVSEMWSSVKNKGNNQDTFLVSLGVVLVWANAIHFSDLQISASKAQPVLFTFQLVQFLPLQHAFVFLFPFLPLAPNFTPVTAFHLSVFLLHCAMNCLLTFSDFFRISRLSVVHLPRLSLSLSMCVSLSLTVSWLSMRHSWQKLPPTVTEARPTRNLGCQDQTP